MAEHVVHPFEPVYDSNSRVLILGSLPSPDSRRDGFYYGHARNRFWPLLAALLDKPVPVSREEKRTLLLQNGIALYDSVYACDIEGASDASIRHVVPADLAPIFAAADIRAVFCNGQAAYRAYQRWQGDKWPVPVCALPSTSPANAAFTMEKLKAQWQILLKPLRDS